MERKRAHLYHTIFVILKRLLKTAIAGYDDLIVEVSQNDTYYIVRSHESGTANSYFASLQIRNEGVFLQLYTFTKTKSFRTHLLPKTLVSYADPVARSLVFASPIDHLLQEIMGVVGKAVRLKRRKPT